MTRSAVSEHDQPDSLYLRQGPTELALSPGQGGAIIGWHHGGTSLMRKVQPGPDGTVSVRQLASYPLIPFSNRIAHGQFSFGGQSYTLPRDTRETRHAIHGNALLAPWEIIRASPAEAWLRLASSPNRPDLLAFPFAYEATQLYRAREDGFEIEISIRNQDRRAMPAGMGHHLYFPRLPGVRVRFAATAMWESDQEALPAARTAQWRSQLEAGLGDLDSVNFDNCFEGWAGQAILDYPEQGYRIRIEASPLFGHAVFFTPPGKDFFAFEPVSHLNNAINQPDGPQAHGLKILKPDEAITGWIRLSHEAL